MLLETYQSEVPVLTTESKHEARDTRHATITSKQKCDQYYIYEIISTYPDFSAL